MNELPWDEVDALEKRVADFAGKTGESIELMGWDSSTDYGLSPADYARFAKTYPQGIDYMLFLLDQEIAETQGKDFKTDNAFSELTEEQKTEIEYLYRWIVMKVDTANDIPVGGITIAGVASTGEERVKILESLKQVLQKI